MINVRFEKSEDGKSLILTVKGHAGQAQAGKDLICASASILTYTAAQIVLSLASEKKLKKKPILRLDSGDSVIVCKPRKDVFEKTFHSFKTLQTGFAILAENYPEYVRITKFGEAFCL